MPPASRTPTSFASDDTGLRCLNCGYNLTGNTLGRCPECGSVNSRESTYQARVQPATPWDEDEGLRGFFKTVRQSLFSPRALAESFPAYHNRARAAEYSLICYVAALVILVAGCALSSLPHLPDLICAAIGFVAGVKLCEWMVARWLTLQMTTQHVFDARDFWRGMLRYLSAFVVLESLAAAAVVKHWSDITTGFQLFLDPALPRVVDEELGIALAFFWAAAPVLVFLWWWLALGRIVHRRAAPDRSRQIAGHGIPIIAAIAFLSTGVFAGAAEFIFGASLRMLLGW